jgi:hypothetical protein
MDWRFDFELCKHKALNSIPVPSEKKKNLKVQRGMLAKNGTILISKN